jgi:hypothetical protein
LRSNGTCAVQALKCLVEGVSGTATAHSAAAATLQDLAFDSNGPLPPPALSHLRACTALRALSLVATSAAVDIAASADGGAAIDTSAPVPTAAASASGGCLEEIHGAGVWVAVAEIAAAGMRRLERAAVTRGDPFGEELAHMLAQRREHCTVTLEG